MYLYLVVIYMREGKIKIICRDAGVVRHEIVGREIMADWHGPIL